jgi:hypothetical protein
MTKSRKNKIKLLTPTSLPSTMISLGETFGSSLTLAGARHISHINVGGPAPKFWVDIYMFATTGGMTIHRSKTNLTRRQARDLQRYVTRKIAVFLFENKAENVEIPGVASEDVQATRRRM